MSEKVKSENRKNANEKSAKEYFAKNTDNLVNFGNRFMEFLNDDELIKAYAEKDLEKLAKVWKLVFEVFTENSEQSPTDKLAELIGAYNDLENNEQ